LKFIIDELVKSLILLAPQAILEFMKRLASESSETLSHRNNCKYSPAVHACNCNLIDHFYCNPKIKKGGSPWLTQFNGKRSSTAPSNDQKKKESLFSWIFLIRAE